MERIENTDVVIFLKTTERNGIGITTCFWHLERGKVFIPES